MKHGALLVNAARGPVVATDALVEALQQRRIRAAVDVTDPEPLPPGHPLWSAPNCLITPHIGGSTPEFIYRAFGFAARPGAALHRRRTAGERRDRSGLLTIWSTSSRSGSSSSKSLDPLRPRRLPRLPRLPLFLIVIFDDDAVVHRPRSLHRLRSRLRRPLLRRPVIASSLLPRPHRLRRPGRQRSPGPGGGPAAARREPLAGLVRGSRASAKSVGIGFCEMRMGLSPETGPKLSAVRCRRRVGRAGTPRKARCSIRRAGTAR